MTCPCAPAARRVLAEVLMLALAACAAPTPAPTPITFNIAVTELAAPLAQDLADAYRAATPGISPTLMLVPQSGLAAELAAGRAALALTANPEPGWFATPVGAVQLALVVNPANPLTALSLAQARVLFAGLAADWSQVGGAPGVVQVVTREAGSDGALAFQAAALGETAVTLNALIAPTWAAMRTLVGESPAVIGYLPAGEIDPGVRPVALEAPLTVLIAASAPAEPTGPARDFLAWAQSPAGQAAATQSYVPAP